jgi:hypothetical protein
VVTPPTEPTVVVDLEIRQLDKRMNGRNDAFGSNFNEGSIGRGETVQIARIWKSEGLIRAFGWPGDRGERHGKSQYGPSVLRTAGSRPLRFSG